MSLAVPEPSSEHVVSQFKRPHPPHQMGGKLALSFRASGLAGDQIVLGSSSVFGTDSEVQTIRRTTYDSFSDTTTLDLYALLDFTHLGEVVTVDGRDLDMRTEVWHGMHTTAAFPAQPLPLEAYGLMCFVCSVDCGDLRSFLGLIGEGLDRSIN